MQTFIIKSTSGDILHKQRAGSLKEAVESLVEKGKSLRGANLRFANFQFADLRGANFQDADFQDADLRNANFQNTDLRGTDLRGTNLDFSCWPLWCGSLLPKVDRHLAYRLAYHFATLTCDDEEVKAAQRVLYPLANQFHRISEVPRLEG